MIITEQSLSLGTPMYMYIHVKLTCSYASLRVSPPTVTQWSRSVRTVYKCARVMFITATYMYSFQLNISICRCYNVNMHLMG